MRDYHAELFDAKPIPPRQPAAWKLAVSVKAMAKRITNCRRVSLYPIDAARLPASKRSEYAGAVDEAIKTYFVGIQGAYALDWALELLERPIPREGGGPGVQLPDDLQAELFVGYCRRRATDVLKGVEICFDANRWLSSRIDTLRKVQNAIPESIDKLRTKDGRERLAAYYVEQVTRLSSAVFDAGLDRRSAIERTWAVCRHPLAAWGLLPTMPKFNTEEARDTFLEYHLQRWHNQGWWARRLRKIWDQFQEHCAILLGHVRKGVSAYVSSQGLRAFLERQQMAAAWLKDMEAYNAQDDITISLEEAVKASIANPENRRHELIVRARGFSDLADEQGYVGLFITWTAPSRFHPWKTVKASQPGKADTTVENKKYEGHTPRDTQRYIAELWGRCRAALDRNRTWRDGVLIDDPIEYFGFRVVEPHHDGTPHWHMLLWVRPEQQHRFVSILQRYALSHNKDDLVRKRHPVSKQPYSDIVPRFDWRVMDKEKGDAVGYIVMYVAKNIDGHRVGEQGDLEAETSATDGARRARAWSSLWGIYQFQPLGGPAVGIWRELRRLPGRLQEAKGTPVMALANPVMEECRRYADAADWKNFVLSMGGPRCRRADRPLALHHSAFSEPNQYGEPTHKLVGVRAFDGHIQQTRTGEWVLRKCGAQSSTEAKDGGCWSVDEHRELVGAERSEGGLPLGALATTVRDDLRGSKEDPLSDRNLFHLGLDAEGVAMIRLGLVVRVGDRSVCIRDSELKVTERHSLAAPNELSPYQIEAEARRREKKRRAALDEVRGLLAESGDSAAWLASMTGTGADDALALHCALEDGDAEAARARLDQLRDTVDLRTWPLPPVERRREAISNAEFFGPSVDDWGPFEGGQDMHRTIIDVTQARLADVHPEHREALLTHLMDKADAVIPDGGDIVAFVADRLRPLPPEVQ
jgi:hypothetical protein